MNKIIEKLHIFNTKALKKASLLRKLAATSILATIIISLFSSNLAFAEIGGGTRILAMLGTRQGR